MAVTSLTTTVPRAVEQRAPKIARVAKDKAKPAPRRVARVIDRQYVQKQGFFDPHKARLGFDNRQNKNRFNGCKKEYGLVAPEAGFYCGSLSKSGIYASLAAEAAFYAPLGASKYKQLQRAPDLPMARQYFEPSTIFPSTKILIEYEPASPLLTYSPFDDVRELEMVLSDELELVTDHLLCIYSDAPQSERDKWITERIARELDTMRATRRKKLDLESLLEHPQYIFSAPLGNAILAADVGLSWSSVRGDVVPQMAFLEGSQNLVLPVQADLSTGLLAVRLHHFDSSNRKFISEPADPNSLILPSSHDSSII